MIERARTLAPALSSKLPSVLGHEDSIKRGCNASDKCSKQYVMYERARGQRASLAEQLSRNARWRTAANIMLEDDFAALRDFYQPVPPGTSP